MRRVAVAGEVVALDAARQQQLVDQRVRRQARLVARAAPAPRLAADRPVDIAGKSPIVGDCRRPAARRSRADALAMFCGHAAHGAGAGAHDDALGRDDAFASAGRPSSSEPSVTPVAAKMQSPLAMSSMRVDAVEIVDAPAARAAALVVVAEQQPALNLAADAAQRRRRQHAFGRAARAHVDVDAGVGVGGGDHARRRRRRGSADAAAEPRSSAISVGVARAVEHAGDDLARLDALGRGDRRGRCRPATCARSIVPSG